MNTLKICSGCGTPLEPNVAQGLCPRCLMREGVETRTTVTTGGQPFVAPIPAELGPHFPQLEVMELMGQGGMGAVYKARQRGLDRLVALKILPPLAGCPPGFAERFTREARALARLSHPNIVVVHDFGQAGGYFYFLMEYVDGLNLRQVIAQKELKPREALTIVPQICEALQFAHDEGIVHRDIKPENILLDRKGRVKIADFGLAKLMERSSTEVNLTGPQQVMGTPRYMAPEQFDKPQEVDHRADIYSLGVVFYEMLTGEVPMGRFVMPSEKAQIDGRLDDVVLRTLSREPDRRYQQVSELKTDVERISGIIANLPPALRTAFGFEYRSRATLFGLPLLHVASGPDPATGRRRVAKGIIALGDIACGVIAIGGIACGGFACGGLALGGVAVGGLGLGVVTMGGAALALILGYGGLAIAPIAVGGFAAGYYSMGGFAAGMHPLGSNAFDPEAKEFFRGWGINRIMVIGFFCWALPLLFSTITTFIVRRKVRNAAR